MNLGKTLTHVIGIASICAALLSPFEQYADANQTGVPSYPRRALPEGPSRPADWITAQARTDVDEAAAIADGHFAQVDAFDLSDYSAERLRAVYPDTDAFLGEELQPGEIEASAGLIATLVEKVRADYEPGSARRDAHPKSHGCVVATMQFDSDLPVRLTGGVIQSGASYDAVVRFSNGSPDPTAPDITGDTRGMAVKLLGVPGEKLFPDPGDASAQDFIMISSPDFFINSAENYTRFFEAVNSGKIWKMAAIPFYLGARGSVHAVRMLRQKIANPLETRYWSVVPSQLGAGDARQAIKFSARPLGPTDSRIPDNPAPDFLRQAMAATLADGPYQMEFMLQLRGDTGLSVEDSVPEWPEDEAPFQRVGVLTIHQQEFDTPERNAYCENQSFNPWHSLPEHRPLGMISRTRRVVYQAIADLRHQMNDAAYPRGIPAPEEASN